MNRRSIVFAGLAVLGATIASLFYNGVDLVFYAGTGILLLVAFGVAVHAAGERAELPLGGAGTALAMLVLWSVLALAWTDIVYLTVLDIGHLAAAFLAYAACRLLFASQQARNSIAAALVVLGCVVGAWMIGQVGSGLTPSGPLLNPNAAAAFLNMIWPICAAVAVYKASSSRHFHATLALTGFLLVAAFLDGSRAALLSAVAALVVVVSSACVGRCSSRRILALVTVFGTALILVQVLNTLGLGNSTGLAGSMASLGNPGDAGSSRWPIWQATLGMIAERPWLGFGPGTFFQVYPAWRLPGDGSAGNFAHNDYLQFWAERGLPGLVLLLLIGVACFRAYLRAARHRVSDAAGATVAAASASLAAAAVHALFSFNLYLLPFMCLCGIAIAALEYASTNRPLLKIRLGWTLTRPLRVVAFVGLLSLPATVWTAIAASDYRVDQAAADIRAGEFEAAGDDFRAARRLWGVEDVAWALHADMLRAMLGQLSKERLDARRSLKEAAVDLTEGARQRNPWRPVTPTTRGRLHLQAPDPDAEAAEAALRRALSLDPRFTPARLTLARLLRERGDVDAAWRIMEQGLEQYSRRQPPIRLMRHAVELRRMKGDSGAADRLEARIEAIGEPQRGQAGPPDRRARNVSLPDDE